MKEKARIIELTKHLDPRGNLSVVQEFDDVPFKIARAYWVYDVPGGEYRGSHAFRRNDELIIALSGSFDVVLDSGEGPEVFSLNRSYYGLYVPRMTWRELRNFSTNSLALVIASEPFDESDYIRDFATFHRELETSELSELSELSEISETSETSDFSEFSETSESSEFSESSELSRPSVYDCSLIELPRIEDRRGNITPVHPRVNVPFDINRVFYTYDIPAGKSRGAHAHRRCHQFIIAASGSFEVLLDDGINKRTVLLNRPFTGLHVPPGIWSSEQSFSSGSICLALASDKYDESDYIRDYNNFKFSRSGTPACR